MKITVLFDTGGLALNLDVTARKGADVLMQFQVTLDDAFPEISTTQGDLALYKVELELRLPGKPDVIYYQDNTLMSVAASLVDVTIPWDVTAGFPWSLANYKLVVSSTTVPTPFKHAVAAGRLTLLEESGVV